MSKAVRCLIFDYGCVISRPQDKDMLNTLCEYFTSDLPSFNTSYRRYRTEFDSGLISYNHYWKLVARSLNKEIIPEQIELINDLDVKSWVRINEEMLSYIYDIRDSVAVLAVLSNMTFDTLAYIRAEHSWIELFDKLFFSCEIGMSKPEPGIYTHCLKELDNDPDQCLFIDDSEENVEAAKKLGINSILFSELPELRKEINNNYLLKQV